MERLSYDEHHHPPVNVNGDNIDAIRELHHQGYTVILNKLYECCTRGSVFACTYLCVAACHVHVV